MLKRILVANRGEIAARILRCCREMNIETVAIYSEADRDALFTTIATRSICIGPPRSQDSYLNQDAIITAALGTGCDGIHPGFGFLSENAEFAARVRDAGLVWVGPTPEVIALMGDKNSARALMLQNDVPVVPGSDGILANAADAQTCADKIGYPVLIKASAGGGGRGMRRIYNASEVVGAFAEASAEATSCFGNGALYMEKLVQNPRHVEFQILADEHGNVLHLGERDCSLQRNHQKVLEEAPAQILAPEQHAAMAAAAIKAARACNYTNAGTVEFIVSETGEFYFIEMNTRIQVEHPVTEAITGINIVREQIRIASGLPLRVEQGDVAFSGHAIECRINAENPDAGFRPCPGTVDYMHLPSGYGIRVDTVLHPGYTVSPFYDSMIAKIIVSGRNRHEAILRMRRALEETIITGIDTNLGMLYMLMYHPAFINNRIDTEFIGQNLDGLLHGVKEEMML